MQNRSKPTPASATAATALYELALQLGPLLSPGEVGRRAVAWCREQTGATAGVLIGPDLGEIRQGEGPPAAELWAGAGELGAELRAGQLASFPGGGLLATLPGSDGPAGFFWVGGADRARAGRLLPPALPLIGQAAERAGRHDRLRRAEASRDQMVSLLAHDIRSPLVATHASIEVVRRLLKGSPVAELADEALSTGLRSVRTAVELCNDLLEVRRIQAGHRPTLAPLDGAQVIAEVRQMMLVVAAQRECRLEAEVAPGAGRVLGDARLLQRLLINLVSNALRFVPHGGEVRIVARPGEDGALTWCVVDNGPGVAPEDRERIFEPYIQGSGEAARGTGLGLTFCREVALLHGGRIWVEDAPGGGCRFCVTLRAA